MSGCLGFAFRCTAKTASYRRRFTTCRPSLEWPQADAERGKVARSAWCGTTSRSTEPPCQQQQGCGRTKQEGALRPDPQEANPEHRPADTEYGNGRGADDVASIAARQREQQRQKNAHHPETDR